METAQKRAERLGRDIDMHRQWLTKDFADLERMIAAGDFKALARATEEMELSIEALRRDVLRLEGLAVREAYTVKAEDITLGMETSRGVVTDYQKGLIDGHGDLYVQMFLDNEDAPHRHRHGELIELAH